MTLDWATGATKLGSGAVTKGAIVGWAGAGHFGAPPNPVQVLPPSRVV
jgi:hypothetical protein